MVLLLYLPPFFFFVFLGKTRDRVSLDQDNNGNGLPEPGETIEIEITLANISEVFDVDDVEAELDSDDDVNIIDDRKDYGRIRDKRDSSEKFLFRIDEDFQGTRITFEIDIEGEIDGDNKNFGMDIFTIPVWTTREENGALFAAQTTESLETVLLADTAITDSPSSESYGGAVYCINSSPTIENNIIMQNSADFSGGGIYCGDNSAPTIVNNVIARNSSGTVGGGISCNSNSSPTIINNTVYGNSAGIVGGGISSRNSSSVTILNTIVWANTPTGIYVDSSSSRDVTYSDLQETLSGEGNISSDPRLLNASSNNYTLRDSSPCVGTGIMKQGVPGTDIEGNARPNPLGSSPDMGAYESSQPSSFPTLTSVTPATGTQGATNHNIVINGRNFLRGASVSFSGSGIAVNSTVFIDFTRLAASISISSSASAGPRNVIVTNPDNRKATGSNMFTVNAASNVIVSVGVAQTVARGQSFSVAINVENVSDLAGFQFDVSFDPTFFEAVQVDEGSFLKDSGTTFWLEPNIDNTDGEIIGVASALLDSGGVDGSGTLADIMFKAKRSGQSSIRPQNVKLQNSKANLIPATVREGIVNISDVPPWDINGDGIVDISDLVLVGQYFGQAITTPVTPNPDVNGDGIVDIADLVLVGQNFGQTNSQQAAPSKDIWSVDPEYLPMLANMYDIMDARQNSDPGFLNAKDVLRRLIDNNKVSKTELFQNYPNPFNPETWIPFQLSEGADVAVRIYNSTGMLVRVLDLGFKQAGSYVSRESSIYWDGRDQSGEKAASGVYFYTVRAGDYAATRKMLLVK